jgi:hypothetical protein
MTGRDIPALLGIFACVLLATALTWWLAERAFEYFRPAEDEGEKTGKDKGIKAIQSLALATVVGFASPAHSQTLDLQVACSVQAKKTFQEYSAEDRLESAKVGMSTLSIDYRSHYNTKINRCLILTDKTSLTGGGQTSTSVILWDVLERRTYAIWLWQSHPAKKYREVPPISCELTRSFNDKKNCTSREEFDAFVADYMEQ